jgi:hypothetical protein
MEEYLCSKPAVLEPHTNSTIYRARKGGLYQGNFEVLTVDAFSGFAMAWEGRVFTDKHTNHAVKRHKHRLNT